MGVFIISDGKGSYIRQDINNRYVPVRNRALADEWDEKYKAQNILKNAVSKKHRKSYQVIEESSGITISKKEETISLENSSNENEHKLSKEQQISEVKKITADVVEDGRIAEWEDRISSLNAFVEDAEKRRQELSEMISNVDKEVIDIQHYIELNDLNCYQGWLAFKMLQNRLRKRRKIKNELQVLSQLGDCKVDSSMLGGILKAIKELDNKVYTPRVLTQLFN